MEFITSCCGRPIEDCPGCPTATVLIRMDDKSKSAIDLDSLSLGDLLDIGLVCDVPGTIDLLVENSVKQAQTLRPVFSEIWTSDPVRVYWNPASESAGLTGGTEADRKLCKQAVEQLGLQVAADVDLRADWWVKVAESTTVRRIGEVLQFLPSKWSPGIGGRPVASTVATGLLGAGLGYGAGLIGEQFLPEKVRKKDRIPLTAAIAGGLMGAGVGAVPGFANLAMGQPFNAPSVLTYGKQVRAADSLGEFYTEACKQAAAALFASVDADLVKEAMGTMARSNSPLIRMDELGRVIWGGNATASTTLLTSAAMHGASQMPDSRARPGTVTPHQTGLLSLSLGAAGGGLKGYLTGRAAGTTLALLTGLPQEAQDTVAMTGLGLGIANAVVPRILGLSP